jgi:conjugative transposon TraM protein
MTINFKKHRYIVPIILLPFFCIFFFVYKLSFGKEKFVQQKGNALQENVADVSDDVKKKPLDDKFDAYKKQYKDADGYTAVSSIAEEQSGKQQIPDLYNQREKQMLDSIEQSMKHKYGLAQPEPGRSYPGFPDVNARPRRRPDDNSDRDLAAALAKLKQPAYSAPNPANIADAAKNDPMKIFREQMSLIDSMGKANDPEYKAEQSRQKTMAAAEKEIRSQKTLPVSKAPPTAPLFNTITAEKDDGFIQAIIDQSITGYAGSRLRIRLLDDMSAGKFIIKKGTYLYAQISGFTGQRVNLTISSIFQDSNILPVKLEVYDNDGLPGLYVPASAFREFSKELGGTASQGITIQQQAENNSQMVMSLVQKMFQSTTTAVSKLIRQNKANLKYNSLVYLIDPNELKNKQSKY